MKLDHSIIYASTYLIYMLIFQTMESIKPARDINKAKYFKIDVISILVVALAVLVIGQPINGFLSTSISASIIPENLLLTTFKVALAVVVNDFIFYVIHYSMHKFDTLWKIHAWHHSAENLYWFSGNRGSFFEYAIVISLRLFVSLYILGLISAELMVYLAIVGFFKFFVHTNTDYGPRIVEYFVATPNYHRLHHSPTELQNKNLAFILPLWDRLFGTYYDPKKTEPAVETGLGDKIPDTLVFIMLGLSYKDK